MHAMVFLVLSFTLNVESVCSSNDARNVEVEVDTEHSINHVDNAFIGFTIDAGLLNPNIDWWRNLNFSSPKLLTLVREFSPTVLRFGGSEADWLIYNRSADIVGSLNMTRKATVMTWTDMTKLVLLARATGNRLVFGLNIQTRYVTQWNPTNTIELMEFCSQMGYCKNVDWELGNEPENFDDPDRNQAKISPEQIGEDFLMLKKLLNSYADCRHSAIYGPDIGSPTSPEGGKILGSVANMTGSVLKALTFHHYYINKAGARTEDYLNATYFSNLEATIDSVKERISTTKYPDIPLWLGETGDANSASTANMSDRFISGFMWLEKLGLSAAKGLKAVIRQTLLGGHSALVDENVNPNPDYWLSWLHKKLVGSGVFTVRLTGVTVVPTTRVYAHCTRTEGTSYQPGAVTAFALNVDRTVTSILDFNGQLGKQEIDFYLLEADGPDKILSKWVKLNDVRLVVSDDNTMPRLRPRRLPSGSSVRLPPLTMAYLVFPYANIQRCNLVASLLSNSSSVTLSRSLNPSNFLFLLVCSWCTYAQ